MLLQLCESDLEQNWLLYLHQRGLRLPDAAQKYVENCKTRPDFEYTRNGIYAAIYVDGSQHDYPYREQRDQQQTECLEDYGYRVIRFGYQADWDAILRDNMHIFGGDA